MLHSTILGTFTSASLFGVWCLMIVKPLCDASGTICYAPDGRTVAEDNIPCDPTGEESFCCGKGWACLDNKTCVPTDQVPNASSLSPARGLCTDKSWQSNSCPNFCVGANDIANSGQLIIECSERGTYCCGNGQCDCNSGTGTFSLSGGTSILSSVGLSKSTRKLMTDWSKASQTVTVSTSTLSNRLYSVASRTVTVSLSAPANTYFSVVSQTVTDSEVSTLEPQTVTVSAGATPQTSSNAPLPSQIPNSGPKNSARIGVGATVGALALAVKAYFA